MGWLIALGIVFLLAILPLGASVKYDAGGPLIRVIAGPVRFTVFPTKKKKPKAENKEKDDKTKESKKAKPTKDQPSEKNQEAKAKGGSITDFIPLVHVVLDLLEDFGRKLHVDRLELKLIMAGDDPCDLAINYGRAWAAVGNLFPLLERVFVIKKRNVEVECDFTASEMLITARLDLTITLGRILSLGLRHGIRALREYLQIMKLRKGGASK
jgi:hypothetical protein